MLCGYLRGALSFWIWLLLNWHRSSMAVGGEGRKERLWQGAYCKYIHTRFNSGEQSVLSVLFLFKKKKKHNRSHLDALITVGYVLFLSGRLYCHSVIHMRIRNESLFVLNTCFTFYCTLESKINQSIMSPTKTRDSAVLLSGIVLMLKRPQTAGVCMISACLLFDRILCLMGLNRSLVC